MTTKEKPEHFKSCLKVAGIIAVHQERVLLLKRALYKKFGAGQWAFPVGKVEDGEHFSDCAIREFKEETGISLVDTNIQYLSTYYHSPEVDPTLQLEYVLYEFLSEDRPVIHINDEHSEYEWFTFNEALRLDLIDGELFCLKDYISMKGL